MLKALPKKEQGMIDDLMQGLELLAEESGTEEPAMVSFREAGVLTNDAGFVLKYSDGVEYQITVVQSRRAEGDED